MKFVSSCLIVCALAFIPALAQETHNHAQTPAKKVRQQKVYSCPMHPEVTSKSKGKCPKCGMNLRVADRRKRVLNIAWRRTTSAPQR